MLWEMIEKKEVRPVAAVAIDMDTLWRGKI
jgi:hypothetical protein